jgi:hypothetical protein
MVEFLADKLLKKERKKKKNRIAMTQDTLMCRAIQIPFGVVHPLKDKR